MFPDKNHIKKETVFLPFPAFFSFRKTLTGWLANVRKNYEDIEDLDEDVYCSIAVTKNMLYLGFNGVGMNPENPKFETFIHFQFTTLHVKEVAPVVTAVVCMLIKFWHPFVWGGSQCPTPAPILQLVPICSGCDHPKWSSNNITVDFLQNGLIIIKPFWEMSMIKHIVEWKLGQGRL